MLMMSKCLILFLIMIFTYCLAAVSSQSFDYRPTANLSSSWIISVSEDNFVTLSFDSSVQIQTILLNLGGSFGIRYGCGFYCSMSRNSSCMFAVFIVQTDSYGRYTTPQVVWSANRNNPVGIKATLDLTVEGDLVLRDAHRKLVWSTNTSGRGVIGLNLTEKGNLVLFDANDSLVWQSFDHPTDCLVPGQRLPAGKNLTASASLANWTEAGLFSVLMTETGLVASVQSDPPQVYYENFFLMSKQSREGSYRKTNSYAEFQIGSLALYVKSIYPGSPDITIPTPMALSPQFMKLGPDGHLRVFQWEQSWKDVADVLTGDLGNCNYPMPCGEYGICSNEQCSCPQSSSDGTFFRPIKERQLDLGCSQVTPIICNASADHGFLELKNVTYFTFVSDITEIDISSCKEACLKNCSCKAAMFRYDTYANAGSSGDCYLPMEIFSLMNNEKDLYRFNTSIFIKVQMPATTFSTVAKGNTSLLRPILGSSLGFFCAFVLIGITLFVYFKRKQRTEDVEEDYLDHVPGMPTRFSFDELADATQDFDKKLGEGGFGSVYEGSLNDGTRIAVKRLDGVGHIKKSFLAEVESIGSIHHINLVRLIGFCADKTHRLLVYEYMCNGSLDRWIYNMSHDTCLDWNHRRKIILDVAKGLAYLHEDCRQKIIHLDIKPQNILLDEHYNAKLADFGLSKLIDRDQSQVVTTMRGTPGYLAPEWLSSVITEKVDVYSFGVVVLEILSGRKIFVQSKPVEERYLLTLFKNKAEEGLWLDIVDKCSPDLESNIEEVEKMMQISAWCLQRDHENRPSMSMVIKVMEGDKDVKIDIDYNFVVPKYLISKTHESSSKDVTALLASVLSGPR